MPKFKYRLNDEHGTPTQESTIDAADIDAAVEALKHLAPNQPWRGAMYWCAIYTRTEIVRIYIDGTTSRQKTGVSGFSR